MSYPTAATRKRRTPKQWTEVFERFEQSGLTVSAFCARESISVANFYRQRHLRAEGGAIPKRAASPTPDGFVDLGLIQGAAQRHAQRLELKIDLGEGLMLHLVRG